MPIEKGACRKEKRWKYSVLNQGFRAEGYRYLSRVLRAGLENFVECADRESPRFTSIVDGFRAAPIKLGSDNPDNLYQHASIDTRAQYRLWGSRGTVHYLGFGTQAGQYGKPGGLRTVAYVEASELNIAPDGEFEIWIGPPPRPVGLKPGQHWLATDPEVEGGDGLVIIRQTFNDRASGDETPAVLQIERIRDPRGDVTGRAGVRRHGSPKVLSCAELDDGLSSTGLLVAGATLMFSRWAKGFQAHPNQLPLFDQATSDKAGGDPNIRYYHSYWELGTSDALVVDATPPECASWNFQLNNYWMESLDYRAEQVHFNKHTAKYRADGSTRIIVAHPDVAVSVTESNKEARGLAAANFLSTQGHRCGTMSFRWIKPQCTDDMLPHPRARVVKIHDLPTLD